MTGWQIAMIVIIVVMIGIIIALFILGKRAQKKKDEQDAQMASVAQTVTLLVIDKKKMRIKKSGLPQQVIDQTPKLMRFMKFPIVKVKIGPKVVSMIADDKIYDDIPVKKEIKATVSGLYITGIRGLRGPLEKPEPKKGFGAKVKKVLAKLSGAD